MLTFTLQGIQGCRLEAACKCGRAAVLANSTTRPTSGSVRLEIMPKCSSCGRQLALRRTQRTASGRPVRLHFRRTIHAFGNSQRDTEVSHLVQTWWVRFAAIPRVIVITCRAYRSSPLWRKLVQLVPKKPVVFLGGTCSTTTWRQDVAVPFCRANDFNYFDPQEPARSWSPGLIHVEERAKLESSAFIFYVSNAARSLTSMIEVAYLVARRKNLIAVISRMPVHVGDCDEASGDPERDYITSSEQEQLCRARDELVRLVECNGYPVFETLQDALDSCAALIRERAEVDELISKHALLPLQLVASRYRDRMSHLHFAFIACAAGASHIQFSQVNFSVWLFLNCSVVGGLLWWKCWIDRFDFNGWV